jgi:protein MpaA
MGLDRSALAAFAVVVLTVACTPSRAVEATPTADGGSDQAGEQVVAETASPAITAADVVVRRRIGTSVRGRPIFAYRVGNPDAATRAVVLGNMHGDEPAGVRLARAIIGGPPVEGIDLWVVPTMNPDGLSEGIRQNARGVDLNRNWRYRWLQQEGRYGSGPRPFSEPESRAMRSFLISVDPRFIVSFHQPLYAVDSDGVKNRHLMNRLAEYLALPKRPLSCRIGVCHGTMTGWFNSHHPGACITVEFGYHPSLSYLTGPAARGTVRSVWGHY